MTLEEAREKGISIVELIYPYSIELSSQYFRFMAIMQAPNQKPQLALPPHKPSWVPPVSETMSTWVEFQTDTNPIFYDPQEGAKLIEQYGDQEINAAGGKFMGNNTVQSAPNPLINHKFMDIAPVTGRPDLWEMVPSKKSMKGLYELWLERNKK